jgi:hypothetical protein
MNSIKFVLYKTKLKMRRRYSILERVILRFKFGKTIFQEIHFIFLVLFLLGSVFAAIATNRLLQQIEYTTEISQTLWMLLYFVLLSYGCLSGSLLTGHVLFPEDMQIMSRLPLSQRRLAFFIFAEHISSILFKMLFFFIIPFCVPLMAATRVYVSTETAFLLSASLAFLGLSMGLLLALLIRLLRFFMLRHGAFWKTLILQGTFAALVAFGSYSASTYFLELSADWLRQIPTVASEVNGFSDVDILRWLEIGVTFIAGLGQEVASIFQHPYCPYVLATDVVHEFDLSKLGLIMAGMLVTLSALFLFASRFRAYYPLTEITKRSVPDRRDNFICNALSQLKITSANTNIDILFRKNISLFCRQLEIIQAGVKLFGGVWPWIGLGIVGGIGSSFRGTEFNDAWNDISASIIIPIIYGLLLFNIFYGLRFLLSVDGEQRNVSLLKLAGFSLTDLYCCQVRLLGIALLPPLLLLVVLVTVFGVISENGFARWPVMMLNIAFVSLNVTRIVGMSFVVFPKFEAVHFEESGKFLEQRISEDTAIIAFIGFLPVFLVPSLLFTGGAGATYLWITICWYLLITLAIKVVSDIVVRKRKWALATR